MGDLLFSDAPTTLGEAATAGGFVGTVDLNGVKASHLSFTTARDHVAALGAEGAVPIILQAHLEYAGRRTRPIHHMVFSNWKFGDAIADDMFVAKFGDDYEGIAMLQRADDVTEAKDATALEAAPAIAAPSATTPAKP